MHFKLYCGDSVSADFPDNKDFSVPRATQLLEELSQHGHSYERIDVSQMSDDELMDLYLAEAIPAAVRSKKRIRQVFGSRRHPGWLFGRKVPALIVCEGGRALEVYPHEDVGFRTVTIMQFLERAAARNHDRAAEG
jgi:hypothetical protein